MKFRDPRSIIIILIYLVINGGIIALSFTKNIEEATTLNTAEALAPEYTIIESLDYFSLTDGIPQMSLSANIMRSRGEEYAEFEFPKGVYNYQQKKESMRYQGQKGVYFKAENKMILSTDVKITSTDSQYFADHVEYFFVKDLILGSGHVKFTGDDLKSKDHLIVESAKMVAHPDQKLGTFTGAVKGSLTRMKKYEGKLEFTSAVMDLDGVQSLVHLEGDVWLKRDDRVITAGKADITLENFNKSLKYFVFNDDVKVTEKLTTPNGITQRKAFAERLEGFGREQKMVLSGAPRVETESDVIKGYRITIRENVDLVEVDDAMSDVQVKRKEKKN